MLQLVLSLLIFNLSIVSLIFIANYPPRYCFSIALNTLIPQLQFTTYQESGRNEMPQVGILPKE